VHNGGSDAQAIWILNGTAFRIYNNYLEASGEVFMSGGTDPDIVDHVPADITFDRNFFTVDLRWKATEGRMVIVDGNWLQHSLVDGQTGWGFTLTPRNQNTTNPSAEVTDLTIRHNVMVEVNRCFDNLATDDIESSGWLERVLIHNNVFARLNGTRWGNGSAPRGDFLVNLSGGAVGVNGPNYFRVTHNTVFPEAALVTSGFYGANNWTFTDNMCGRGAYGWRSDTASEGNAALAEYVGILFTKNAVIGANGTFYNNHSGNFFPANEAAVGFEDFANEDFSLDALSAYKNAASDGSDVGVDFDDLEAAMGFSCRPLPDFTPPWITSVGATPGSTTCSIVATASSEPCDIYVEYGTTTSYGSMTATQAAALGATKTFNLSSLTASTLYHYRIVATDAAGNVTTGRDRTFTTS
jgi:hypothetical protein